MLRIYTEHNFERIATANGSPFHYPAYSDSTSGDSGESVTRRIGEGISTPKNYDSGFFGIGATSGVGNPTKSLLFNQDSFI
jgi:hypothetical protein